MPAPLFRYGLTQGREVGGRRSTGRVIAEELTVDSTTKTNAGLG